MNKFWWMFRYFLAFRNRSRAPISMCWEAARIAAEEQPGALDSDPHDAAIEELSYWDGQ